MSDTSIHSGGKPPRDLIDCAADRLPLEARAEYYRILRHCRSLPESDEILRILNAMQLLTILIHDAPARLEQERGALDRSFQGCASALSEIEKRLDQLPKSVAGSIAPEKVAEKVTESLHQRFQATTIPQKQRRP